MAKFCELGIESDVVIGKGIEIEDLFGRRILIEKTIIQPTKYPGKNASGLRMQMQVVLATFNESSDKDGDCYTKTPRRDTRWGKTFLFYRVGHFDFGNSESRKQLARCEQEKE